MAPSTPRSLLMHSVAPPSTAVGLAEFGKVSSPGGGAALCTERLGRCAGLLDSEYMDL